MWRFICSRMKFTVKSSWRSSEMTPGGSGAETSSFTSPKAILPWWRKFWTRLHNADAHNEACDVVEVPGSTDESVHFIYDTAQGGVCTLRKRGFSEFLVRIVTPSTTPSVKM